MFRVEAKQCKTCIYRPDSPLDLEKLEAEVADNYGGFKGHRICHTSGNSCCAGFWARHKDKFPGGQIAQRLNVVEFVDSSLVPCEADNSFPPSGEHTMPKKRKVKKFTQAECRRVESEVRAAVQKVADQLGLELEVGRYRFTSSYVNLPLTLKLEGEAVEQLQDNDKKTFEQYAAVYGLKPENFGQEFDLGDGKYKIVGVKPRATKNTIIVEKTKTSTGQQAKAGQKFVVPHQEIQRALGETVSVGDYEVID